MTSVLNDYIAGAIGGAAGLVVGHPFDTTKVQMQTRQTTSPYKSTWEAVKNISQQGMSRGFFRGMAFPVASYGLINSVFFGVYGNTLKFFKDGEERSSSSREVYLAGCVAGFAQLFVACPVDVVKVVLQSQIPKSNIPGQFTSQKYYYKGPKECTKNLFKTGGLRACYKGFWIQAVRDIPASTIYFVVYEALKKWIITHNYTDSRLIFANLISGGMAGVISWVAIMPFDVVKSTFQADSQRLQYKNILDCVRQVYQYKGLTGFFTGTFAACMRAFPVNAVTFVVYSQVLSALGVLTLKI